MDANISEPHGGSSIASRGGSGDPPGAGDPKHGGLASPHNQFPAKHFENQSSGLLIQAGATSLTEDEAFSREITRELVGRRLGKLREVLNELHDTGAI